MHIIVLEQEPSSRRGGQERSLLRLCSELSQRGHIISLLYTIEGDLVAQYQNFGAHVIKLSWFTVYQKQFIFRFLTGLWKATWILNTSKDSIVLCNQYQDSLFGRLLALSKNVPFVCYLRIPPPEPPSTNVEWQWNIGLKGVKQFIAVSHKTKLDWVSSGFKEEKIDVVHNGVSPEVFKPAKDFYAIRKEWNIPEDMRLISYVGRLDKEKGLETLIKAFALLLKSGISARLLIAGKPVVQGEEYKKSLEKLLSHLGIEKYVSFLGHVDNATSVYQVSDITVLPSLWSEPFGRTVIESMACGTPVVASRTGGIPEILTGEFQSGLFNAGDERDLTDTLIHMINWRNKNAQLGKRCREHVLSQFTVDRMVDGVEKVILRVIEDTAALTADPA